RVRRFDGQAQSRRLCVASLDRGGLLQQPGWLPRVAREKRDRRRMEALFRWEDDGTIQLGLAPRSRWHVARPLRPPLRLRMTEPIAITADPRACGRVTATTPAGTKWPGATVCAASSSNTSSGLASVADAMIRV